MASDGKETHEVQQLAQLLKEFAGEVMNHSARDIVCLLRRNNLSMPQVATLMYLRRLGTGSISDISVYLNLSLAATSQLVDRLVVNGHVSRVEDPGDRRQKQVTLTDSGVMMVEEIGQARVEEIARRLGEMPTELRDALLESMMQTMAYLRGAPPQPMPIAQPQEARN